MGFGSWDRPTVNNFANSLDQNEVIWLIYTGAHRWSHSKLLNKYCFSFKDELIYNNILNRREPSCFVTLGLLSAPVCMWAILCCQGEPVWLRPHDRALLELYLFGYCGLFWTTDFSVLLAEQKIVLDNRTVEWGTLPSTLHGFYNDLFLEAYLFGNMGVSATSRKNRIFFS